jgi:hypothetical protein
MSEQVHLEAETSRRADPECRAEGQGHPSVDPEASPPCCERELEKGPPHTCTVAEDTQEAMAAGSSKHPRLEALKQDGRAPHGCSQD